MAVTSPVVIQMCIRDSIRKLALNQENMQGMDTHFSIKVESTGITDQKSSGRCWLLSLIHI